jgi:hypothetical protein
MSTPDPSSSSDTFLRRDATTKTTTPDPDHDPLGTSIEPQEYSSLEVTSTDQLDTAATESSPSFPVKPSHLPDTQSAKASWAHRFPGIPQLDERDSIFATTYLPSSSPPSQLQPQSSPLVSSQQLGSRLPKVVTDHTISPDKTPTFTNQQLDNILPDGDFTSDSRILLAGSAGGAVTGVIKGFTNSRPSTSDPNPDRSQGLGGHSIVKTFHPSTSSPLSTSTSFRGLPQSVGQRQSVPMGTYTPDDSTLHESPLGSPVQLSTPSKHIHFNEESMGIHGVEEDDHQRRGWGDFIPRRDTLDGQDKVRRSKSKDTLRVDRKIQATLPRTDTQTSTRSRKSSQYLGLFKEQDAAEEQKRRESRTVEQTSKKRYDTGLGDEPPIRKTILTEEPTDIEQEQGLGLGLAEGLAQGPEPAEKPEKLGRDTFEKQPSKDQSLSSFHLNRTSTLPPVLSQRSQLSQLSQLSAGLRNANVLPRAKHAGDTKIRPVTSGVDSPATEEDEESDREQISSALYYPHRQVLPDISPRVTPSSRPMLRRIKSGDPRREVIAAAVDSPIEDDIDQTEHSPNEVQISLQGQDKSQVWHGDLAVQDSELATPPEFTPAREFETAASTDIDSESDSADSTTAYESATSDEEDPNSTPKPLRRHRRPRAPVGAVELKPFNHQVGGHSTVYRFSRRAVCKQLNNRENVFYETVEQFHPELLEFMPR